MAPRSNPYRVGDTVLLSGGRGNKVIAFTAWSTFFVMYAYEFTDRTRALEKDIVDRV